MRLPERRSSLSSGAEDFNVAARGAQVLPGQNRHFDRHTTTKQVDAFMQPQRTPFLQDSARIEAAYRKYFHRADPQQKEDSYEMLVCHANVIR